MTTCMRSSMTWTCRKDGKERKKISSLSYRLMIPRAMLACQPLRGLVASRCGKASCVLWYRLRQSRGGIKVGRGLSSRRWFLKKIKKSVRFTNYSAYWFWWYRWQPGTLQKVLKDLTDIVQRSEKKEIKRSRKFVEISRGQIKYWGVTSTKRTLIIVFFA